MKTPNLHSYHVLGTLRLSVALGFLIAVAALVLFVGNASAASSVPPHAPPRLVVDPCWHCFVPDAPAQGESKADGSPFGENEDAQPTCTQVDTKGPGGIQAIQCLELMDNRQVVQEH